MIDAKDQVLNRIDGRGEFLDCLFDMIRNSKMEVLMAMHYWGGRWGDNRLLKEVIFPKLKEAINSAKLNGSTIRVMGDQKHDTFRMKNKLKGLGVEVRIIQGTSVRFAVVDMKNCLFAISEPYTETSDFYHAIFSNNESLVQLFKDNFENLWAISRKL
jgi:hypothetical protein